MKLFMLGIALLMMGIIGGIYNEITLADITYITLSYTVFLPIVGIILTMLSIVNFTKRT